MLYQEVAKALSVLLKGGIMLYPTDTIWGIGCDASNEEAIDRVFKLKQRDPNKSVVLLLENPNQLYRYVKEVPSIAYELIAYAEKPLTIVFSNAVNLPPTLIHQDGSIAIRIVKHAFCQQLLKKFKKPLVSTSANLSGQGSPRCFQDVNPIIIRGVDHVVDAGQDTAKNNQASTIIKVESNGRFQFIRR